MKLQKYLTVDNIFICDACRDTGSFYHEFAHFLKEKNVIKDAKTVKRLFIKRESLHSTAIGKGAAAPHIFSPEFSSFLIFIGLIKKGIDFKSRDGMNVHLVFLIMSDDRDVGLHLKTLAHIARMVLNTEVVEEAKKVSDREELLALLLDKEKTL